MGNSKGIALGLGLILVFALAACDKKSGGIQGLTDTEIVLGVHTALSGPVALIGVPVTNGQRMRIEEENAKGGVHGRKIRLVAEDNSYSQSKAAQAGDKLLKKDKVFALIGVLGTSMNMVTMEPALKMGVPNLFPLTAAKEMYEPHHKLKFSMFLPYSDQMRAATKWFAEKKGYTKFGSMYQDDDFGLNVYNGLKIQAEKMGLDVVAVTTFKRGTKDFSSQIAKLKAAGVEAIILGTIISETIGAKVAALRLGWKVDMVVSGAGFSSYTAFLAKGATDGLYGVGQFLIPSRTESPSKVIAWMDKHKAEFGKDPTVYTTMGYTGMDLFIKAAKTAGKDLTAEKLASELENIKGYSTIFGGEKFTFSKTKHLGPPESTGMYLSQVKNITWKSVAVIGY